MVLKLRNSFSCADVPLTNYYPHDACRHLSI